MPRRVAGHLPKSANLTFGESDVTAPSEIEATQGKRSDPNALLHQVADSLTALQYEAWRFGDSVAFEGMIAASQKHGSERWLEFARGFVRGWAATKRPYARLDCTAPGRAMVEIYRLTGDSLV